MHSVETKTLTTACVCVCVLFELLLANGGGDLFVRVSLSDSTTHLRGCLHYTRTHCCCTARVGGGGAGYFDRSRRRRRTRVVNEVSLVNELRGASFPSRAACLDEFFVILIFFCLQDLIGQFPKCIAETHNRRMSQQHCVATNWPISEPDRK
uniref:(northern house mosquito) hypothetical protein n=1 Tax=Culex pipiens TaxID=7175 RepID=A0A8D8F6J6_CULPI